PYKTSAGARFFHERSRQVEAPVFYLHVQPGRCFVAAGLWHPQPDTLKRVRAFIADNPAAWIKATRGSAFRRRYAMGGESLARPPRGYDPAHPLIEDLRRKDYIAAADLDDATVTGPKLREAVARHFAGLAPLVDYLCAALDLEF
ncbi:MAG: TIGR02453 family protein, partial [Xanthomonadales bacterium]|nr:TIGR02453 family protein [Xanthomonadales bacterium]